jgi:hypothetical protein
MLSKYTTTTLESAEAYKKGIVAREYLLPVGPGLGADAKGFRNLMGKTQMLAVSGCG